MKRVVVTGIGAVSPFGYGVDCLWSSLLENRNAIRTVASIPETGDIVRIAGVIPGPDSACSNLMTRVFGSACPKDPAVQVFFCAANEAVEMAGLQFANRSTTEDVGVFIADRPTGQISYFPELINALRASRTGPGAFDDRVFLDTLTSDISHIESSEDQDSINHICARAWNITGPQLALSTACASSNSAIGEAFQHIRHGDVSVALAGGAYHFDLNAMIGFTRLGALTLNPDPDCACRPFDSNRSGFVMGSGCGVLVLEEAGAAEQRGAEILCEVTGYGTATDAFRATDPEPEASGVVRAITNCLRCAGLTPADIDYVNAHGTSTRMNDIVETRGLKRALGPAAYRMPISSTKSMIGHGIMAAAALEGIVCIMSIRTGYIHPTRNLSTPDPELDLDYVPNESRSACVRHALSNSFGFGGQNATIMYSAYEVR